MGGLVLVLFAAPALVVDRTLCVALLEQWKQWRRRVV
jgi:hypothetical protein